MIPNNSLSTPSVYGAYVYPYNLATTSMLDYEMGPIGLSDPSQGARAQLWKAEVVAGSVSVSASNTPTTALFSTPGVVGICLTFDQNAHPFVAFTDNLGCGYWWYDTQTSAQTIARLPVGCSSVKARLDDKRPTFIGTSDIILTYLRAGGLYFRQQRDRFNIEYTLTLSPPTGKLVQFGMSSSNRMQWGFVN